MGIRIESLSVETDSCDRPLAPYPASKRAAEMLGFTYHHLNGLNFTALRFFTVYGPRNRPDMMAHMVVDNLFFGRKVALYSQGQLYRDWTYIDDIVHGVVAAVDRPLGYEVINLGRGSRCFWPTSFMCWSSSPAEKPTFSRLPCPIPM